MIYKDIDYIAYDLYVKAAMDPNKTISRGWVDKFDVMVSEHNEDDEDFSYYYEMAKIELRKQKLKKLDENF